MLANNTIQQYTNGQQQGLTITQTHSATGTSLSVSTAPQIGKLCTHQARK